MLKNLTREQVDHIIHLAEQLNAKDQPSPSGLGLDQVSTSQIWDYLQDRKPLVNAIAELGHDARMELMALMWVGMLAGRDPDVNFKSALEHAYRSTDAGDVGYIAEKAISLPTYLRA